MGPSAGVLREAALDLETSVIICEMLSEYALGGVGDGEGIGAGPSKLSLNFQSGPAPKSTLAFLHLSFGLEDKVGLDLHI